MKNDQLVTRADLVDVVHYITRVANAANRVCPFHEEDWGDLWRMSHELDRPAAAPDGDEGSNDEAERIHDLWVCRIDSLRKALGIPDGAIGYDPGETAEETIGNIVGQLRDQLQPDGDEPSKSAVEMLAHELAEFMPGGVGRDVVLRNADFMIRRLRTRGLDLVPPTDEQQPSKLEGAGPGAAGVARATVKEDQKAYVLKLVRGYRDADNPTDAANELVALFGWIEAFATSQMATKPTDPGNGDAVRALREVMADLRTESDHQRRYSPAAVPFIDTCIGIVERRIKARLEAEGRQP